MKNTDSILEQYREADFERRLNLFLECPALRNRFIEIDQNESAGRSALEASRNDVAVGRCCRIWA